QGPHRPRLPRRHPRPLRHPGERARRDGRPLLRARPEIRRDPPPRRRGRRELGGPGLHRVKVLRLPVDALAEGPSTLPADAATYVTRVHRLGAGDRLLVFDPERAVEADAEVASADRRAVVLTVGPLRPAAMRPSRAVTLFQGVGKGDKLDAIVRDATELGVTRVVPVLCARSVARPDAARAARWRRIAV